MDLLAPPVQCSSGAPTHQDYWRLFGRHKTTGFIQLPPRAVHSPQPLLQGNFKEEQLLGGLRFHS